MVACVGASFALQGVPRCCTKALEHTDAFPQSSRLTCKSPQKGSGPEGTRTPGLRHARAALSRLSYGPWKHQQS